ncbi:hypothetical protein LguiA_025516 [Lonicera macranthoides]
MMNSKGESDSELKCWMRDERCGIFRPTNMLNFLNSNIDALSFHPALSINANNLGIGRIFGNLKDPLLADLVGVVLEHAVEGEGHTTTTHQHSVEKQCNIPFNHLSQITA